MTINGGSVTANGGKYCAGIGGGFGVNRGGDGGIVEINGGTVTAIGGARGAGIGGGGSFGGSGGGWNSSDNGTLTLGAVKVTAGDSGENAVPKVANERITACHTNLYVRLVPCDLHEYYGDSCKWCSVRAFAYPLWVGRMQVTDANKGDILGDGTAKFGVTDGENILTLTGAAVTGKYIDKDNKSYNIYSNDDQFALTIRLVGENSMEDALTAIYVKSALTLTGTGSLDAAGLYSGATMLFEGAGPYVLIALAAFMAGVIVSAALIRNRKQETGRNYEGRESTETKEEDDLHRERQLPEGGDHDA